jgi:PIN domain nuclease of toxin-antitoxin system
VTYLLDTHVWVWWNVAPDRLSRKVSALMSDPGQYDELLLSAISLWEFCKLLEKGRLGINASAPEWMREALDMPKLRVAPLTPAVVYQSTVLPGTFHDDPADQIIVATARELEAVLITKDERIRKYPHVRSLW